MSMANCIQSNKDILTEDPFRNIQTLFGSVKLFCSPITCGCLNLWQTVKLPQLGCMLFRSWMGFQTLVILQGQAPDTPTLLEAFLLQEARSSSKKYRLTKACWENGSCLTWRHYGLLERSSEGRKVWSFFMWLHEYTQYLCWKWRCMYSAYCTSTYEYIWVQMCVRNITTSLDKYLICSHQNYFDIKFEYLHVSASWRTKGKWNPHPQLDGFLVHRTFLELHPEQLK